MGRAARLMLVAATLASAGCGVDLGVRNTDLTENEQAKTHPAPYWEYRAVDPRTPTPLAGMTDQQFTLGTQRFIVQYPTVEAPQSMLKTVGSVNGANVFAPSWAEPPFDWVAVNDQGRLRYAAPVYQ